MNILLPGKCQRYIPLQLTRFPVFHSLTKIHADLCECCAKPKEKCKQADQYHPCGDSKKLPATLSPYSNLAARLTMSTPPESGLTTLSMTTARAIERARPPPLAHGSLDLSTIHWWKLLNFGRPLRYIYVPLHSTI